MRARSSAFPSIPGGRGSVGAGSLPTTRSHLTMIGHMIGWAIFGLVAGAIARLLHPGRDPMNWIWTMFLGIGGALLGGWIGGQLGFNTSAGVASWVAAVCGSILLLFVHHMITTRKPGADGTP